MNSTRFRDIREEILFPSLQQQPAHRAGTLIHNYVSAALNVTLGREGADDDDDDFAWFGTSGSRAGDNSTAFSSSGGDGSGGGEEGVSLTLTQTRFVVQMIVTPMVVSVGLLGNVLNVLVLVQPAMRTSTNVYLLTLAVADMAYLAFSFALSFVGCRRPGLSYGAYLFNTYGRTVSDMAGNVAVWIIVIFTVERYVAVCHPMYGKMWCTVTRDYMSD